MTDVLVEYRIRIRNLADTDDELVVSSVRGGTNPYLSSVPAGDGPSLDVNTGRITSGSFGAHLVDPITSGTDRLFTSKLDDAGGRPQLGQRKAFYDFREDGGAWQVLYAGRVSRYGTVSDIEWDIGASDWMQAEHEATVFDARPGESIVDFIA